MSFRGGRGRGRGGGRFGGRGFFRRAKEEAFEPFPEIEELGPIKFSMPEIKKDYNYVLASESLENYLKTTPYYYEDKSQSHNKVKKLDIERYSDRNSKATIEKPPLWHFIKMGPDHMPAELVRGEKRVAKRVRWDSASDFKKFDAFEKLEKRQENGAKKEGEEEEEEEAVEEEEDEGEYSDEGDYEQNVDFDDDEDDYNMADENDEPEY